MICELIEEQNSMNRAVQAVQGRKFMPALWHLKQAILQQFLVDMQNGTTLRNDSVLLTLQLHFNNG